MRFSETLKLYQLKRLKAKRPPRQWPWGTNTNCILIPKAFGIDFCNGLCRYIFEVPLGEKHPPRQKLWRTKGAIQIVIGVKAQFK
jgi:hypothetical protein